MTLIEQRHVVERATVPHSNVFRVLTDVLDHPADFLNATGQEREHTTPSILAVSESRGQSVVLKQEGVPFDEHGGLHVVANTGAQIMNSRLYFEQLTNPESAKIIRHNESVTAPTMLAFTRPEDTFVYYTNRPDGNRNVLDLIGASFDSIGIPLTQNYEPVEHVDRWFMKHPGVPVLPHVLEPALLEGYKTDETKQTLREHARAILAAYTKDGFLGLAQRYGHQIPETHFFEIGDDMDSVARILAELFPDTECVINIVGGSGGFGILKRKTPDIVKRLPDYHGQRVQVQPYLPHSVSPGLIANLTDKPNIVQVAKQRFANNFGVFTGNIWHRDIGTELDHQDPEFFKAHMDMLNTLYDHGVRGTLSIDSVIMTDDHPHRERYQNPTVFIEANIRQGGSSVIARMRQGNIDGNPISRIHTSNAVDMAPEIAHNPKLLRYVLEDLNRGDNTTRVVVYNVRQAPHKASLAFVAAEHISESELLRYQKEVEQYLRG